MRFIGSHQIIKSAGVANRAERDNRQEGSNGNQPNQARLFSGGELKLTLQDIQAGLLLFSGLIFLLIGLF